jgi:hypothetical protein
MDKLDIINYKLHANWSAIAKYDLILVCPLIGIYLDLG